MHLVFELWTGRYCHDIKILFSDSTVWGCSTRSQWCSERVGRQEFELSVALLVASQRRNFTEPWLSKVSFKCFQSVCHVSMRWGPFQCKLIQAELPRSGFVQVVHLFVQGRMRLFSSWLHYMPPDAFLPAGPSGPPLMAKAHPCASPDLLMKTCNVGTMQEESVNILRSQNLLLVRVFFFAYRVPRDRQFLAYIIAAPSGWGWLRAGCDLGRWSHSPYATLCCLTQGLFGYHQWVFKPKPSPLNAKQSQITVINSLEWLQIYCK